MNMIQIMLNCSLMKASWMRSARKVIEVAKNSILMAWAVCGRWRLKYSLSNWGSIEVKHQRIQKLNNFLQIFLNCPLCSADYWIIIFSAKLRIIANKIFKVSKYRFWQYFIWFPTIFSPSRKKTLVSRTSLSCKSAWEECLCCYVFRKERQADSIDRSHVLSRSIEL